MKRGRQSKNVLDRRGIRPIQQDNTDFDPWPRPSMRGLKNIHGRNRQPPEDPLVTDLFGPPEKLHRMEMRTMSKKHR